MSPIENGLKTNQQIFNQIYTCSQNVLLENIYDKRELNCFVVSGGCDRVAFVVPAAVVGLNSASIRSLDGHYNISQLTTEMISVANNTNFVLFELMGILCWLKSCFLIFVFLSFRSYCLCMKYSPRCTQQKWRFREIPVHGRLGKLWDVPSLG